MENLKIYRKRKGYSQADVAGLLGIAQNSYSRYENGSRQPDVEMLKKLSEIFEVSVDELLGNKQETVIARPIAVKPELVPEDEAFIPLVCSLRCGFNYAGEPFTVLKRIPVPKSYLSKWGETIVAVEAAGKSMMPTIRPRDLLICIPGDAWSDGQIVVADVNDSDTIKRIFRSKKDGGIDLVPDNELYEPMHYTPEDLELYQVHILGRVVKVIGPDL